MYLFLHPFFANPPITTKSSENLQKGIDDSREFEVGCTAHTWIQMQLGLVAVCVGDDRVDRRDTNLHRYGSAFRDKNIVAAPANQ